MFHKAKLWFSIIFAFLFGKRVPSAQSEEKQPYRLNLQFFADGVMKVEMKLAPPN